MAIRIQCIEWDYVLECWDSLPNVVKLPVDIDARLKEWRGIVDPNSDRTYISYPGLLAWKQVER